MANVQAPNGFQIARRQDGAEPNYSIDTVQILNTNTNKIAFGDPVILLATGFIDKVANNTTTIYGIFYGCEYVDSNLQRKIWQPSWTGPSTAVAGTVVAKVCSDPMAVFRVQAGGSAVTGVLQADVGANIGVNVASTGSPNQAGYGVAFVDQTTIQTTATLPFRIVGLSQVVNNDPLSPFDWVDVKMNNQAFNTTTGI